MKEREFLKNYLKDLDGKNIVCIGDFNANSAFVKRNISSSSLEVITPIYDKTYWYTDKFINNYSYLSSESDGSIRGNQLDHIITNCQIENARYCWDFIDKDSVYPVKDSINDAIWEVSNAYPNHAVLFAEKIFE